MTGVEVGGVSWDLLRGQPERLEPRFRRRAGRCKTRVSANSWAVANRSFGSLWSARCTAVATATDLDISVESGGLNSITVSPGQVVSYDVVGELTDSLNEGLALFSVDLDMPGATLTPAATPTAGNMVGFAPPLGLSNPAGFGAPRAGPR